MAALVLAGGRAAVADSAAASRAVAAEVAARWAVDTALVTIAWGREGAPEGAPVAFRLSGTASDGWFTVVCTLADGSLVLRRVRAGVRTWRAVAARDLARGEILASRDILQEPGVRWGPPLAGGPEVAVGWEVARPLAKGDALAGTAVRAPVVIRAGDPVELEYVKGVLRVEVTGTAVTAARAGAPVHVKVEGRRERLAAIAVAPGHARLDRRLGS